MILLGLAADPFLVCPRLPKNGWSLNSLDEKTAVFIGVPAFMALRQMAAPNRVLIFDNRERSERLAGLTYIPDIDPDRAVQRIKAHTVKIKDTRPQARDHIAEMIEKHKDRSAIHLYNTFIYQIKFQPTRNAIKETYLAFWNNEIDRAEFDRQMQAKFPKRGETKEAVEKLMKLTTTPAFTNLQAALAEVEKLGPDAILDVAAKYKIEPFDINYVVANKAKAEG